MISISVGFVASTLSMPGLVVSGLRDGRAMIGEVISVATSDEAPIASVAWGLSAGASDLGTSPSLTVPALEIGASLFVTIEGGFGVLSTELIIMDVPTAVTLISAGPDALVIDGLADAPDLGALSVVPSQDTLIVEFA